MQGLQPTPSLGQLTDEAMVVLARRRVPEPARGGAQAGLRRMGRIGATITPGIVAVKSEGRGVAIDPRVGAIAIRWREA